MFYQENIEYTGDPVKAVCGNRFIWTEIANDIPVTRLQAGIFLAKFRFFYKPDTYTANIDIVLTYNSKFESTFIGESVILYELLGLMFKNSIEAGASIFSIEVLEKDSSLVFKISDDGSGVHPESEHKLFKEGVTTKAKAAGFSLLHIVNQVRKIGGTVTYAGEGINKKGASFEISLLKDMPSS